MRSMWLIGCSINELCAHLESLFKPGMSWQNFGEWEVDHIKPCCKFNLLCYEEQAVCFHFSNLQPLWMRENRRKGGRYNAA